MLRLEIIDYDLSDGGFGYGGDYGGSGSLVLNDYLPEKIAAQTGELWLAFINEPTKKPFKVADVAAGQKVQIPFVADTPIRLYLVSHDPTGHRTTTLQNAVTKDLNINRELKTPEITQIGESTLTSIQIGIKNYTPDVRFRKIETADNDAFTVNYHSEIKDYDGIVRIIGAIETLTRDFSTTEQTKKVRISHSTTGSSYSEKSNTLTVTFENSNNNGVPALSDEGAVINLISETMMEIIVPLPVENGYGLSELQLRWLNNSVLSLTRSDHAANTNFIEVSDVAPFSSTGGRAVIGDETLSYTGIYQPDPGMPEGTLIGVVRGIENSTAAAVSSGVYIYGLLDKKDYFNPSNVVIAPRLEKDSLLQHRWRNSYYQSGKQGLAEWKFLAFLDGTISTPTPEPYDPAPPPISDPTLPEDPRDPANDKGRGPGYFDLNSTE